MLKYYLFNIQHLFLKIQYAIRCIQFSTPASIYLDYLKINTTKWYIKKHQCYCVISKIFLLLVSPFTSDRPPSFEIAGRYPISFRITCWQPQLTPISFEWPLTNPSNSLKYYFQY